MLWPGSLNLEKVHVVYRQFNRGAWMGVKVRKIYKKKLTGSRKAIRIMKGLTGDDYMHVYSHY